jgi:hypothetical protein
LGWAKDVMIFSIGSKYLSDKPGPYFVNGVEDSNGSPIAEVCGVILFVKEDSGGVLP